MSQKGALLFCLAKIIWCSILTRLFNSIMGTLKSRFSRQFSCECRTNNWATRLSLSFTRSLEFGELTNSFWILYKDSLQPLSLPCSNFLTKDENSGNQIFVFLKIFICLIFYKNSFSETKIEHLIIYRFNKSLNNFTYVIPVLEQVLTIYKFRAGVLRVHVLTILIYLINYVVFLVILPHDSWIVLDDCLLFYLLLLVTAVTVRI